MSGKKLKREKSISIEDIYKNKNFVPPKEKNLETIFEEPKESKDGVPILTSVRKYRRYLHFDPTQGKIQKRKVKAKRCVKKMKLENRVTRSAKKASECDDIFLYMFDALGEDTSDNDMDTTQETSVLNTSIKDKSKTSLKVCGQTDEKVCAQEICGDFESDQATKTCNVESDSLDSQLTTSNNPSASESELSKETDIADIGKGEEENLPKSPRSSCCVT